MAGKIILPHQSTVAQWNEEKVIKWLKRVHLEDCIPAFEARHIDGAKLLELSEQKLFTYQDMKIKHRKQIAKCVQECRSQASTAKRLARSIRHNVQGDEPNGGYETGDSGDWGSDFEDDSEDEAKQDGPEQNNNTLPRASPEPAVQPSSSPGKSIPKPPDVPLISKSINGLAGLRSSIPRPPLKRPPSQPPPPPLPQGSGAEDTPEDYEVPIQDSGAPSQGEDTIPETYELIENPDEEYEVVDGPTPVLPPRLCPSPPPPLPQKPRRLKEGPARGTLEGPASRSSSPEKDAAQNMATRPLPPVPLPKEDKPSGEEELRSQPWFRALEREQAASRVVALRECGAFVVRPGVRAGQENPFSLTVLHEGRVFHLNIRRRPDGHFALGREKRTEKTFPSVCELIRHHQSEPILLTSRGEPAGRTRLTRFPDASA